VFNLSESDITIPTHCPALGIPLEPGGESFNSPSLDRLRPERGYTPGNVVVISHLANSIKHSATSAQVAQVAEWMRSIGL
jgi:hypothetical protein